VRCATFALLPLFAACATARPETQPMPADGEVRAAAEEGRSIVRRAGVRVERSDPEAGPPKAVEIAKSYGGYAQLLTDRAATVRIPEAKLDAFLAEIPRLGKIAERRISAQDVTEVHRDLKVRLESLDKARQRYLELLSKAQSVAEAVLVEKELERVTAEFEAMKAQLDALQGSVALASVELQFDRPVQPGPLGWVFYGIAQGIKWLFIWD
jgi:hypothetical protein